MQKISNIYIEFEAVRKIINNRVFQSMEFNQTKMLISIFNNEKFYKKIDGLNLELNKTIVYIWSNKPNTKKNIVFNLDAIFSKITHNDKKVQIIQKILRFSIKHWNKLSFSHNERIVNNQKTAFIFPFSSNYKVGIERYPLEKRFKKREIECLLVYIDGDKDILPTEAQNHNNLRRIVENSNSICKNPESIIASDDSIPVGFYKLTAKDINPINPAIGFKNWKYFLSEKQQQFVYQKFNQAERLEGPAGSGKTLSLVLKTLYNINEFRKAQSPITLCFITHSIATKEHIIKMFQANCDSTFKYNIKDKSGIFINICTLQELCIDKLEKTVHQSEYIDRDAYDSKEYQKLYIEDCLTEAISDDYPSFKKILSPELKHFFEKTDVGQQIELIQNEIAVIIKGMSDENIETYKKLKRPDYAIKAKHEFDLDFLYLIYEKYSMKLRSVGLFDTDDIVLTSLSQFNTPIWRRRRLTEGYDFVIVDETHLFNFNELSVFHHLLKSVTQGAIIFSIDKSQSFGDLGQSDLKIDNSLKIKEDTKIISKYETVFRSSPDIINLSYDILSNGATLFTNFTNSLINYKNSFTAKDEKLSLHPFIIRRNTDEDCLNTALEHADLLSKKLICKKADILICITEPKLFTKFRNHCTDSNVKIDFILRRGDIETVNKASQGNKYVAGMIDYVGGLEFSAVIIVGCDKGRVPPKRTTAKETHHFINYSWHNKLYVAISRAKYTVEFIIQKSRGASELLSSPLDKKLICPDNVAEREKFNIDIK